ncbi:DUF7159 family protein [[Mycobacterium] kokjensenii]
MAPPSVRMVLVEGERAAGVTVDEDGFEVDGADAALPEQVVAAILGTQESARESGYRLASTGVTVTDQLQAGRLRDVLADHRVENVMLVSAFLAAAALAQVVGGSVGYQRTALMFVEPGSATLAVVDSSDGSVTEVQRVVLPADDAAAVNTMKRLAAEAGRLPSRPAGLFVVGSGVNVDVIKPELDAASLLPVSVPEEPETALARGAALASAHAPLFDSSTSALAWARDPGTGMIDPDLVALSYSYQSDYDATVSEYALAYSAVPDDTDSGYLPLLGGGEPVAEYDEDYPPSSGLRPYDELDLEPATESRRKPFVLVGSGLAAFFVVGVTSLAVALAVNIRPTAADHPPPSQHIVVPTQQAPAPAPAPEVAPKKAPPVVQAPAPPAARPVPAAPAPAPAAPAPPPAAPAPVPIPIPVQVPVPAPAAPAPIEVPAPAAPAPPPPVVKKPAWPPIFNPPKQNPPKQNPPKQSSPGNDGGGKKGGAPSPWLPGVGSNGGGSSPWLPGFGGGGNSGGGRGNSGWPF